MATVVGVLDRDFWSANTDNIVIADPATKSLTWIPRDLWCPSLNHRVNRAFARGGVEGLVSALGELGFPCDHGVVLRRGATERAAMSIAVEVPVEKKLDFWYPLHPTLPIHGPRKPVSFRPPSERLSGDRIHEWVGARKRIVDPGMRGLGTDGQRMRRQQVFVLALLEQHFDFSSVIADKDLVRISGEDALRELALVDATWRLQSFDDVRNKKIGGMMVLLKANPQVSLGAWDQGSPQLAVVVLALGAPVEAVDAVQSLLEQEPQVELVVVNSGGGGMAQLLARHGIDVPVIEREEKLYAGAARNIGIGATRAPYVAFLASDCMATSGWARARIAAHRAGAAAVGSAVVNGNPRNSFAWAGHLALWSKRVPGARSGLAYGASYDRSLFEQHGFFREDLSAGEDTEFKQRLPELSRPEWNGGIHTIHRNPTGLLPLIADQFRRGARAACFNQACRMKPLPCGFKAWRGRTRRALRASRNVSNEYRVYVRLARPLIPVAVAAYCFGARYWLLRHGASASVADRRTAL